MEELQDFICRFKFTGTSDVTMATASAVKPKQLPVSYRLTAPIHGIRSATTIATRV